MLLRKHFVKDVVLLFLWRPERALASLLCRRGKTRSNAVSDRRHTCPLLVTPVGTILPLPSPLNYFLTFEAFSSLLSQHEPAAKKSGIRAAEARFFQMSLLVFHKEPKIILVKHSKTFSIAKTCEALLLPLVSEKSVHSMSKRFLLY